ncbi:MAG: hypothetical protein ACLR76_11735 [Alistipes sp.]
MIERLFKMKPEEIPAAAFRDFPAYGGLNSSRQRAASSVVARIARRIVRDEHAIHPS